PPDASASCCPRARPGQNANTARGKESRPRTRYAFRPYCTPAEARRRRSSGQRTAHAEPRWLPRRGAALLWCQYCPSRVRCSLRRVVPKHRADQIKPRGLRALVAPALEVGAHHARCCLRPAREVLRPALLKAIQLFRHGIGVLADALNQLDLLDDRRRDLLIAESSGHVRGALLCLTPQRNRRREDVANSAGGFDRLGSRHRRFKGKNRGLAG